MKKIYHLSTCDTCKRILNELQPLDGFLFQDIKNEAITKIQLEEIRQMTGSYEALFSKRARLYKERGLKDKKLSENDFKSLILEHYTFLNRPVIIVKDQIFIGNNKKTIAVAKEAIHG
ncbi:arsenate reductase family protein [Leptobacterium sp. I13]|uniref:arsenate reductase family protein n=1 Tax=Leptobacterium meishanense TaxID=3128904 RepID=UPI0030ED8755